MSDCEKVYEVLEQMGITYRILSHPAVWTAEEADRYVAGQPGAKVKCLFLSDQKSKRFHLVAMNSEKRLDIKALALTAEEKSMKFCSPERLMEKLGLIPGMVSVFGLLNNEERDVHVWLDQDILTQGSVMFHPNDNTKTLFLAADDLLRFLKNLGYGYEIVSIK